MLSANNDLSEKKESLKTFGSEVPDNSVLRKAGANGKTKQLIFMIFPKKKPGGGNISGITVRPEKIRYTVIRKPDPSQAHTRRVFPKNGNRPAGNALRTGGAPRQVSALHSGR